MTISPRVFLVCTATVHSLIHFDTHFAKGDKNEPESKHYCVILEDTGRWNQTAQKSKQIQSQRGASARQLYIVSC